MKLLEILSKYIQPYPYISGGSKRTDQVDLEFSVDAGELTPAAFLTKESPDLFAKCHE